MELNSMNAHLTSDAMERVSRWDRHEGPELQLITAGTSVIVLARGERAVDVFNALHPLLGDVQPAPVAVEDKPLPRPTVEVVTGPRSAR